MPPLAPCPRLVTLFLPPPTALYPFVAVVRPLCLTHLRSTCRLSLASCIPLYYLTRLLPARCLLSKRVSQPFLSNIMWAGTLCVLTALVVTAGATKYVIRQTGLNWEDALNPGTSDITINQGDHVEVLEIEPNHSAHALLNSPCCGGFDTLHYASLMFGMWPMPQWTFDDNAHNVREEVGTSCVANVRFVCTPS